MPKTASRALALGQHATPSAIRMMAAMRLMTTPTPAISSPNKNLLTMDGETSKSIPLAASAKLVITSSAYMDLRGKGQVLLLPGLHMLIEEPADAVLRFLHKLAADLLD